MKRQLLKNQGRAIWKTPATMVVVALVVLAPLVAAPDAWADEHEAKGSPSYTRVGLWQVERNHWGDFVDLFEKHDKPILEKLFADGVITEWGIDSNAVHRADGYTHSTWVSAPSMSALAKAGEAYEKAWMALGDDVDTNFNDMVSKHRDYIIETEKMRAVGGTYDGGYFHGHQVEVTQGKYRQFMSYWKNRVVPVYEKLMSEGAIVAYGLSEEAITTGKPNSTEWWVVMADADGFDKVKAAFDASWEETDEEGRRARWLSIMDVVEEDSYREWLTNIIHMQVAAH